MPSQLWLAPLTPMSDDAAVSYTNSTTLTAVNPGGAVNPPWFPGIQVKAGAVLELEAWGTISTSGSTPSITMAFYYGGTAGTILAGSSAVVLTNQAAVAWPWRMSYKGRIVTTGTGASAANGNITGIGTFEVPSSLTAFTLRRIPETTAAMSVLTDTTINKALVVGATWSAAAATNILICSGFVGKLSG